VEILASQERLCSVELVKFVCKVSSNCDITDVVHNPSLMKPGRFGKWFCLLHDVTGFGKNPTPLDILVELKVPKYDPTKSTAC
jgi:hypothetical protein